MRLALVVASLLAAACQKSSRDATTGSGSGSGSAKARTTFDITLPPLSGKPPVKTTAPVGKPTLDRLAEMRFDDFQLEVNRYPVNIALRQRGRLDPRISVNVFVAPCNDTSFKCRPMKLDAWLADKAQIEADMLDEKLRVRPDTVFDISASSIGGEPAIGVYQAAQFFGKDDVGNPVSSYSLAYTLYYNDGVNFLRTTVTYSGDPYETLDQMKKALPRPFLEKVATAFVDVYGQAWAP